MLSHLQPLRPILRLSDFIYQEIISGIESHALCQQVPLSQLNRINKQQPRPLCILKPGSEALGRVWGGACLCLREGLDRQGIISLLRQRPVGATQVASV